MDVSDAISSLDQAATRSHARCLAGHPGPTRSIGFSSFRMTDQESLSYSWRFNQGPNTINYAMLRRLLRCLSFATLLSNCGAQVAVQACTAVARDLAGFIWAIGQPMPQQRPRHKTEPVMNLQRLGRGRGNGGRTLVRVMRHPVME